MNQSKPRIILLGLDGATFDVIRPLVEQGELQHLSRLLEAGAHGTLRSIIPPITGPAWSVLATGKNPGQLGVYDFMNRRRPDDFQLYPIRSQDLAGQTFWDILNSAGYRVGILNYPMLVPAYPLNGWMVAGLGASKFHNFTYPSSLKEELDQITGGYEINVSYGLPKYRDNLPLLIGDMRQLLHKRMQAVEHLLATAPVDVLVVVFSVPDVASHTLWEYWAADEGAAVRDPFIREMKAAYISIWRAVDQAVGQVLTRLATDGHALIVSDHGFGPSHGVFHVNQWLQQAGYLVRKTTSALHGNRTKEWLVRLTTPLLGEVYRRLLGSKAHRLLRASILREIDLNRSIAFALDSSDGCGGIYINRQYARQGDIDEVVFIRDVSARVKQDLLTFGAKEGLDIEVFTAEELYTGDKVELAPELLITVDNHRCSVSYRFEEPISANRRHHSMKSGNHRLNGVLIAIGPKIKPGIVEGATLQDIAPTLLHLAEMPIPADCDGRVLSEIFMPEFTPDQTSPVTIQTQAVAVGEMEEEETEAMLQRLANLGYLD